VRVFQMRRARLAQHAARRRLAESPRESSSSRQDLSGADLQQPFEVQNGHQYPQQMYAPPPRKKQGRSQGLSHSVDRLYSNASSTLSHSPTEASSISVDSRHMMGSMVGSDDERGGFSTSNRFSRFTNPSRSSTLGLTSCFGLDSPSNSLRGSWPTAPKRPDNRLQSPGPCTYNAVSSLEKMGNVAPRGTIGNSPRNTSENFIKPNSTLGGGKFLQNNPARAKTRGGVIGTSSRWGPTNQRHIPGPQSYRPRQNFLSTFK